MSAVLEFLEFIEQPGDQSACELLDRVLMKARQMTGAEAGPYSLCANPVSRVGWSPIQYRMTKLS